MNTEKSSKKSEQGAYKYKKVPEEVVEFVSESTNKSTNGNFPKRKYRAGAIVATVWENKGKNPSNGEENTYNTISLERVYQDKESNWKSTNSFRINDLPKVQTLMQKAYSDLVLKEQELFKKEE